MSRYYRHNPDEEIRHDWITDGARTSVPVQEPLPPNQSFQLPSEEQQQPIENENQLHLNYL